jgi:4-hydroxybenzoyl-CoA reductase subunit beta
MLRLPDFEYRAPNALADVSAILADEAQDAMVIAGGTDITPKLKRRQFTPDIVVSMRNIEGLDGISREGDEVHIGALTTLATIEDDPIILEDYPGLATGAESVATPNHRRVGTIGGNLCQDTRCYYYDQTKEWREGLDWCRKAPGEDGFPPEEETIDEVPCRVVPGSQRCWAIFASDVAPALIAHEASITLVGNDGERTLPLTAFYRDNGIDPTKKAEDELVTSLHLPPADGVESTYLKLSQRETFDFPSLGVAAAVRQSADGVVEEARVVLGAVSTRPVVVDEAAAVLEGTEPDEGVLEDVAAAAKRTARPMQNDDLSPAYRTQMASEYTHRALARLTGVDGDTAAGD